MNEPSSRTTTHSKRGPLGLVDDELAACVACGLCLPHCPTFRVTGLEAASPRGRIAAMRAVERDDAPIDDEFVELIESCVQCRGCESACPSGVPFGRLMEGTRAALADAHRTVPRWQRIGYGMLGRHRLLVAGSRALGVAQWARLVPARLGLPPLPMRQPALRATGGDVWLFTGCVMDAWQRSVHAAAAAVITASGATYALPGSGASCCGALHVHAGLTDEARRLARRTIAAMAGTAPIVVDSAGCGAALKDYGHLVGSEQAEAFGTRVVDVHEWILTHLDRLPKPRAGWVRPAVIVQDPCHLRHVQRVHLAVRQALAPYADVVELDDEGLCCGAGGAYATLHPDLAGEIRARKQAAIERARARAGASAVVVSANPGCAMHLAAGGVAVRHPVEIVAAAIGPGDRRWRDRGAR